MKPCFLQSDIRLASALELLRFSKTCESWNSNWWLRFSLPSAILADLLENKTLLQRVQKVMYGICHWWISIRFGCFCVSRFVACDRNYDWRQRKTQLWRQLLNLRVRMFVKSVVSAHLKLTSLLVCIAQNVAIYHGTLSALRAPNLERWSANRGQKREKNGQNCSEWLTFFTFSL